RPAKATSAVCENALLEIPRGRTTEEGFIRNVDVSLQYLESWLRGNGCVPINNLMEDAATVEISRAQIWQWIRHPQGVLDDGRNVTLDLFHQFMSEELERIKTQMSASVYAKRRFSDAAQILD